MNARTAELIKDVDIAWVEEYNAKRWLVSIPTQAQRDAYNRSVRRRVEATLALMNHQDQS